jgi:hypothetical protein
MFGSETTALLRSVLDEVCADVGRYENGTRTFVASRLLQTAAEGTLELDELKDAGRSALKNFRR